MVGNLTYEGDESRKIREMCRYFTEDSAIAEYMRVPLLRVRKIRASIKGERLVHTATGGPIAATTADAAQIAAAKHGSARLLAAYVEYARKYHPQSDLARLAA